MAVKNGQGMQRNRCESGREGRTGLVRDTGQDRGQPGSLVGTVAWPRQPPAAWPDAAGPGKASLQPGPCPQGSGDPRNARTGRAVRGGGAAATSITSVM